MLANLPPLTVLPLLEFAPLLLFALFVHGGSTTRVYRA